VYAEHVLAGILAAPGRQGSVVVWADADQRALLEAVVDACC
jgi:hypothetical protein